MSHPLILHSWAKGLESDTEPNPRRVRSTEIHAPSGFDTRDQAPFVGNYEVLEPIARGGMGAVYNGRHIHLDTEAAIKLLRSEYLGDHVAIQRFLNEALALSRVRHPNVVRILDCGITATGVSYLIMDLLPGKPLRKYLKPDGLPDLDWVLEKAEQIADALQAVHGAGLVHRDLKPSNVQIVPERDGDRAVLLDFGVAKFLYSDTVSAISQSGLVWGTPQYMSPEQTSGANLDSRSDVYSFGALLFELLTGRTPHTGHKVEVVRKIQTQDAPSLDAFRELPPQLTCLVQSMLQRDLNRRPENMSDVAAELRSIRKSLQTPEQDSVTPTNPGPRINATLIMFFVVLALTSVLAFLLASS